MIKFSAESNTFFLGTESSSYIIKILDNGLLCHKYYGAAVACDNFDYLNLFKKHEYMPDTVLNGVSVAKDSTPQEYPAFGRGDFRSPAACPRFPVFPISTEMPKTPKPLKSFYPTV